MNDEDLNNAVARAMGLTRSPGTRIDKNGIETPIVYWGKIEGDTLRLVTGWNPAGDWRYTGMVLEWLLSKGVLRACREGGVVLVGFWQREEHFLATDWQRGQDVSSQRAICLAAIEVGKHESI